MIGVALSKPFSLCFSRNACNIFFFWNLGIVEENEEKSVHMNMMAAKPLWFCNTCVELFSQSCLNKTFDVHIFAWTLFNHLIINVTFTFTYWPFQVKSFNIDLITPPSCFMYLYFHFTPCSLILIIYIIILYITNIFIYLFSKFNHILLIYHIQNLIAWYKFFYILLFSFQLILKHFSP